ncbi:MAG TPA: hypothetical protein VFE62_09130 [Gemmataceae bacterium]|nr:hypothetical protein [Gemmataceae bacterium]
MSSAPILFAQFQQFPNQNQPQIPPELIVVFIVVGLVMMAISLTIQIFYCLTLSKALNNVAPRNRQMEPGMVWLLLIPCFNIVWVYFIGTRIPASLKNEFEDRGMDDGSDYGRSNGLTAAILLSVMIGMSCIPFVNYCNSVVGIVYLVFWIMFWVKIAGYSSKLASSGSSKSRDFDDDEDD